MELKNLDAEIVRSSDRPNTGIGRIAPAMN